MGKVATVFPLVKGYFKYKDSFMLRIYTEKKSCRLSLCAGSVYAPSFVSESMALGMVMGINGRIFAVLYRMGGLLLSSLPKPAPTHDRADYRHYLYFSFSCHAFFYL
jgi:hypothetical protein